MNRVAIFLTIASTAYAHDVITTKVTFDREIVRLFNAHCLSCHRSGGQAFSLATYEAARPWAKAIGEEVLRRRMPPWGAVKGFGDFRDDQGLTPEQLELIVDWEEGGAPEGEPKDIPQTSEQPTEQAFGHPGDEVKISGDARLSRPVLLGALWPAQIPEGASFQVTAELPDGRVYPLLWLKDYKAKFNHPFVLRTSLLFPAGTWIRGVPQSVSMGLIPAADVPPRPKRPGRQVPAIATHSE
jgi:hypothetical protein